MFNFSHNYFTFYMIKKNIFIFLSILFGVNTVSSQQNKYIEDILTFHLLDVESGLSHNFVNDIEQDSLGFIWVATIDGLNRYNGTSFTKFKKDYQNKKSSIINNHISEIKIGHKGDILIATDKGFTRYSAKNEEFSNSITNKENIKSAISCLTIGPSKELVLGSSINEWGVKIIDNTGKITVLNHQQENRSSLSSNKIFNLLSQGDSVLWIGTSGRGLNKYNYKTKKITRVDLLDSTLSINSLFTDSEGNLWVGSNNGIRVLSKNGETFSLNKSLVYEKGLSDDIILSFEEDDQNKMWIGTRNGGLNILDIPSFLSKKKLSIKWFLPKSDGSSVYNRTVSSIKKDNNGNMWIGTSTGLNFVNPKGEPIKLFDKNTEHPNRLSHNRIGAFAQKADGKIWIGTDGAGLNLFDPNTGKFLTYRHNPKDATSLSNDYILSLLEDTKNRVWAGTYCGGINKIDWKTGQSKRYLQNSIEDGSDVRKIFEDTLGQIWVGTNRGGLYKYLEIEDKFKYIKSIGKKDIRDIINDDDGNLWLATYGDGVLKYNPKTESVLQYKIENTKGMTSNVIFCILRLKNGEILAGTRYAGLIKINPKTRKTTSFTENDGLSNNNVSSIIKENDANIWLGTFDGISHFNSETNIIKNLNTYNNIQRSEFNIGAALKDKNGYLYFGGNKGFNMFHPKKVKGKISNSNSIVFENIQVLNKKVPVTPNIKDAILKESISYQDQITLNHNENVLTIDFSLLKYPVAKKVLYCYKLEGYHKSWINNNSIGKANLINIPPGEYLLRVKAKLDSGKEVFNKLAITIVPPFYKTTLFYLLCLLLIILTIYIALKYYSKHINLKNSLLFEKKQRQLEQDFNKERMQFFTNFSHELRTPLTLILGPLDDLLKEINTQKQVASLKLIKKNATYLSKTINKLLEFRKSEVGLNDLVIGKYNLPSILKQLVDNYSLLAQKKGVKLTYTFADKDFMAYFDLEKIQIIVNNLLSNSIKHSKEKGSINLTLDYDEKHFKIIVEDTGSGIHPDDFNHIFECYYQSKTLPRKKGSGIGLALSKKFAEFHDGTITVSSEFGKGATFTLIIPRDKALFSNAIIKENATKVLDIVKPLPLDISDTTSINIPEVKKEINVNLDENRLVILIIDDNLDILEYLKGLLDNKYDIIYSVNGQEGIEKAIKYVPDLIISDIMMPKKSGIDLCSVLKKEITTTHIPIILLTAKSNTKSIKQGYEIGADDYIIKPFNSHILLARIKNLIDNRTSLRKYFLDQEKPNLSLSTGQSKQLDKEKEFLRKLDTVILKNLKEGKANVKNITNEIGMSRTPLFRKIKAITGENINEYITRVKLKKAASLIKHEGLSVSQAAFEVGYNSTKYFRQIFKKQFGVLPSKYKK